MDVVVTVPQSRWLEWIEEGDLPDEPPSDYEFHWMFGGPMPDIQPDERVYIVAFGRLRGYSPLYYVEESCQIDRRRHCLVRLGGAEAVTIEEPIRGFRGWRYRWWALEDERPFPDWVTAGVRGEQPALMPELACFVEER
jgi:hypothetical protein